MWKEKCPYDKYTNKTIDELGVTENEKTYSYKKSHSNNLSQRVWSKFMSARDAIVTVAVLVLPICVAVSIYTGSLHDIAMKVKAKPQRSTGAGAHETGKDKLKSNSKAEVSGILFTREGDDRFKAKVIFADDSEKSK